MKVIAQTNAEQLKERAVQLRGFIMRILGWTLLDWNNFQFETGMEYLDHYVVGFWYQGADAEQLERVRQEWIKQMAATPIFWSWWRNQWALRDEEFSKNDLCFYKFTRAGKEELYREVHNAKALSQEIYPNSLVIKEAEKALSK